MKSFYSKGLYRIPLFGFFVLSFVSACLEKPLEIVEDGSPLGTIWKLNKNVEGLKNLANACMTSDSIAIFNIKYNDDGSVMYWLSMKEGGDIELYSEIVSEEVLVPELSMKWIENEFYWTVNDVFLFDSNGERVAVTDLTKPVSFLLYEESICCKVHNSIVGEFPLTKAGYLAKDIAFDYDIERGVFNLHLSSGFTTTIPTISEFHLLDENVINRSFYKDVFLDAGISLHPRKSLPAASYIGLSLEGISLPLHSSSTKDRDFQASIISGDSKDLNGRLLYPDGQPRYRLLFVNGGDSKGHGQSLGEKGRETIRTFVKNGGSYLGICAGAFLASNGFDKQADYPDYLSIWSGMMTHTGLKDISFGMIFEKDSPLLHYYDFGGDSYVDSVYHSSGGYASNLPAGTEVLARFDYPKKGSIHKKPGVWAYKESPQSGRVVLCGSHPEGYAQGERRDLMAAMLLYAMDGQGVVSLKGLLKNGEVRVMDKKTTDNNPDYTRIGDLQTHHFATYIPPDAKNIRVELNSSSDCDFALMMNQGTYAFSEVADYHSAIPGARQQLSFSAIREGIWFIAVKCLTTVTVNDADYAKDYSGKTEVLNGVPYKIMISWE